MAETFQKTLSTVSDAIRKRETLFSDPDTNAYRLFNGFYEGCPDFSIDRYGNTAVILWTRKQAVPFAEEIRNLAQLCIDAVPEIDTVLFKNRYSADLDEKKGVLIAGSKPAQSIREWGVSYPLDLRLNKDCGFYLDSALLRKWLIKNSAEKRVLNTFAYTGSLGDAAAAGSALSVTQTDLNRNYLSVRDSRQEYLFGDFFHVTASLRRSDRLFDIVLLDPPFFANAGRSAKVDQAGNPAALVNKIRPLAADGGKIVVVNNALFLSGADFLNQIEPLCGEYLSISEIIPVPESFFGFTAIDKGNLPADPTPFNHPTKILVMEARRKDGME